MSLKRILGTMLATRMAGRGRRRGSSGIMSMLGGRRRRGGKMGLAALGYMAYRAYQDQQSRSAASAGAGGTSGSASGSGSSGGLAGMVQDVVDRFSGGSQPGAQSGAATASAGTTPAAGTTSAAREEEEQDMREEANAAESLSDQKALLLIRAMITAAYSDGAMSTEERHRIMGEIDEAGGDASDREVMEREIANPRPLDELLTEVNDMETAEEFYLASRAAVDGESEANRAYLADLRGRLGLSQEQIAEVEELTT